MPSKIPVLVKRLGEKPSQQERLAHLPGPRRYTPNVPSKVHVKRLGRKPTLQERIPHLPAPRRMGPPVLNKRLGTKSTIRERLPHLPGPSRMRQPVHRHYTASKMQKWLAILGIAN